MKPTYLVNHTEYQTTEVHQMDRFIRAEEIAKELEISKPYAYKIIRRLNDELSE